MVVFCYGNPSRLIHIVCGIHRMLLNNLSSCMYLSLHVSSRTIYLIWFMHSKTHIFVCGTSHPCYYFFCLRYWILPISHVSSTVSIIPLGASPSPQMGSVPVLELLNFYLHYWLTMSPAISTSPKRMLAPLANVFLSQRQSMFITTKYGTHRKTHKKAIPTLLGHQ